MAAASCLRGVGSIGAHHAGDEPVEAQPTACAASRMSFVTAAGCEM
jgi:hypothetical protein